jgi:hypothetical protein
VILYELRRSRSKGKYSHKMLSFCAFKCINLKLTPHNIKKLTFFLNCEVIVDCIQQMIETDGKILQLPSFNDIPAVYTFISLINKSEKRNTTEFYFLNNQKTSRQYFFFFFIHHLLCHIHHLSDRFFLPC